MNIKQKWLLRESLVLQLKESCSEHVNAKCILDKEPKNVFKIQQKNFKFHNKCPTHMQLPIGIKSLLGLGLKFCIERPRPYQDLCTSMQKFRKDVDLRSYLFKQEMNEPTPGFNRRVYVESRYIPPACEGKIASAIQRFVEKEMN